MAKEQFREKLGLSKKNIVLLEIVNSIISEYSEANYKLTLRQLYYQLVSRDIIPNEVREYSKLSSLLVKGRMGGAVDWSAIEDRIRVPYLPYYCDDIDSGIKDLLLQYRLDRMKGQEVYLEVLIEKDALSGVLHEVTSYYHISLMVNRGYSSCTAMYNTAKRFIRNNGNEGIILYLGDHDASGLHMIIDIQDRLWEFGADVAVIPVALTMEQIEEHKPPPNPSKITDPRAEWYISSYGESSWEVDALNPGILNDLVRSNIEEHIDLEIFNSVLEDEKEDKEKLQEMMESLR